jgi:putative transposase
VAAAVLDSVVVPRPAPTAGHPPPLCRDKRFDFPETEQAAQARGDRLHTARKRRRGAPPPPPSPAPARHPARRWVIERPNSWHNRFRKLRTRYEKQADNYVGLVHFACALIVYRLRLLLR